MCNESFFIVSLDFELNWGVRDTRSLSNYQTNLIGVRSSVPKLLNLFKKYDIHTTWATVGLLFFKTYKELIKSLPIHKPMYKNPNFSPYYTLYNIGKNEQEDPFHYAVSLIEMIRQTPYQEIGTHTFSHYYCLENGQSTQDFYYDLSKHIEISKMHNFSLESIIFPRNQYNNDYLKICKQLGIKAYRGNENHWLYHPRNRTQETLFRRAIRLLDAYTNLSGHHAYSLPNFLPNLPLNLPSSRFLRPYTPKLKIVEPLRLRRILASMTYAAKHGQVYHLWWHPHNFGKHIEKNLAFLEKILKHFIFLQKKYNMKSYNMREIVKLLVDKQGKST